MAESTIGLYKTELIRHRGPWRGLDDVEFATLEYVDWFNHRRLHGELGLTPPAEFEDRYYPQPTPGHRGHDPIARASTEPGAVHPVVPPRACPLPIGPDVQLTNPVGTPLTHP